MKKLLLVIFSLITFLLVNEDVYAIIDDKNAEIECIYANGIVIGMGYEKTQEKYTAYVKDYPISKTSVIDGEQVSNISLYNVSNVAVAFRSLSCPSHVNYWIGWEKTTNVTKNEYGETVDSDETTAYRGVYAFGNEYDVYQSLREVRKTGWWIFQKDELYADALNLSGTNVDQGAFRSVEIPLVGERIYITDDIGVNAYGDTYKLYSKNEQAVGSTKYAQIYKGANGYYMQVGEVITSIDTNYMSQYLCIEPSITTQNSDRGETAYKFSSIRHKVSVTSTKTCSRGQLYVQTTKNGNGTLEEYDESFCDKYSNTAFVLIDIIKIMQILVPAIVIIFTGIEIGRIVLAGNIEEELPKRKKSIFIRLIVMIAFFLLPIIVQLIISLAEGVSIMDVSCLFNDGATINKNEDSADDNSTDDSDNEGSGDDVEDNSSTSN